MVKNHCMEKVVFVLGLLDLLLMGTSQDQQQHPAVLAFKKTTYLIRQLPVSEEIFVVDFGLL